MKLAVHIIIIFLKEIAVNMNVVDLSVLGKLVAYGQLFCM